MKTTITVCLLALCCNSCSTVGYRTGIVTDPRPQGVYPAVQTDIHVLSSITHKSGGSPTPLAIPLFILMCADLPISALTDTLYLPYDVWHHPEAAPPPADPAVKHGCGDHR